MTKRQASRYRRIGLSPFDKMALAAARRVVLYGEDMPGLTLEEAQRIVAELGTPKERQTA